MWIIFDNNETPRLIAEHESYLRVCLKLLSANPANYEFNIKAIELTVDSPNPEETARRLEEKASAYLKAYYPKIWESFPSELPVSMAKGEYILDATQTSLFNNDSRSDTMQNVPKNVFVIFENDVPIRVQDHAQDNSISLRLDKIYEDKSEMSLSYFFTCFNIPLDKMNPEFLANINRLAGEFLFYEGINNPYESGEW